MLDPGGAIADEIKGLKVCGLMLGKKRRKTAKYAVIEADEDRLAGHGVEIYPLRCQDSSKNM